MQMYEYAHWTVNHSLQFVEPLSRTVLLCFDFRVWLKIVMNYCKMYLKLKESNNRSL